MQFPGSKKLLKFLIFFDGIVSVENVNMFKTSPLVYEHFNMRINSTKSDSWLISGNPIFNSGLPTIFYFSLN